MQMAPNACLLGRFTGLQCGASPVPNHLYPSSCACGPTHKLALFTLCRDALQRILQDQAVAREVCRQEDLEVPLLLTASYLYPLARSAFEWLRRSHAGLWGG